MAGAATDNRNILDYLNEDCWKAVLDYVPVEDIIRTERASRRWQNTVLVYLRGVRIYIERLVFKNDEDDYDGDDVLDHKGSRLTLKKDDHTTSLQAWIKKLGPSVVSTHCATEQSLKVVAENCPNLEALTLIKSWDQPACNEPYIPNEPAFMCLRRLHFQSFSAREDSISRFITRNNTLLEHIEIKHSDEVTGKCLNNVKLTALKSLVFNICPKLKFDHLLSAINHLGALSKLVIIPVPVHLCRQIHLVLEKLPNLEHLRLDFAWKNDDQFFEYVGRLKNLKSLSVDIVATDVDLEDITQGCKELRSLKFGRCDDVTSRGLEAVRRNLGHQLTSLGLRDSRHLTDDDAIACIRACPNLTYLDVKGWRKVTHELLSRAAAARRRMGASSALRLRVPANFNEDDNDDDDDDDDDVDVDDFVARALQRLGDMYRYNELIIKYD